ncbi:hypothetical protein [Actinomadura sp. DC4]|uniref:hypothetical protein n=1 Tax=Actinomadura sp. DC4 TaxID=3055069 RepID=UPI0025B02FF6|nr:hypothetical protein [Actinomadura sp. DC4]MDN3359118.1 hypothetical protein [Actinomadura sp. DC4]
MNELKCTYCGATGLEPGFILDSGGGSPGYTRWVEGRLERGVFGGAKLARRPKWRVEAFRCPRCLHLEMFAS